MTTRALLDAPREHLHTYLPGEEIQGNKFSHKCSNCCCFLENPCFTIKMIAIFTECHTHYLEHKARILGPWTWVIIYKAGIDEHTNTHTHTRQSQESCKGSECPTVLSSARQRNRLEDCTKPCSSLQWDRGGEAKMHWSVSSHSCCNKQAQHVHNKKSFLAALQQRV